MIVSCTGCKREFDVLGSHYRLALSFAAIGVGVAGCDYRIPGVVRWICEKCSHPKKKRGLFVPDNKDFKKDFFSLVDVSRNFNQQEQELIREAKPAQYWYCVSTLAVAQQLSVVSGHLADISGNLKRIADQLQGVK